MGREVETIRTAPGATPVLLCLSPDGGLDGWTARLAATGASLVLGAGTLETAASLARSCRPDLLILGSRAPADEALAQEPALRASPFGWLPVIVVQGTPGGPRLDGIEDTLPWDLDVSATAIRLRAVLRRARPEALTSRLLWGDLELRQDERCVLAAGDRLTLSFQEFNLLALLMEEPGRTWSRDELCTALLGAGTTVDPKSLNRNRPGRPAEAQALPRPRCGRGGLGRGVSAGLTPSAGLPQGDPTHIGAA